MWKIDAGFVSGIGCIYGRMQALLYKLKIWNFNFQRKFLALIFIGFFIFIESVLSRFVKRIFICM